MKQKYTTLLCKMQKLFTDTLKTKFMNPQSAKFVYPLIFTFVTDYRFLKENAQTIATTEITSETIAPANTIDEVVANTHGQSGRTYKRRA